MKALTLPNLTTHTLGRTLLYYPEIDSTQVALKDLMKKSQVAAGTCVFSSHQTHGLGTHGRSWYGLAKPQFYLSFTIDLAYPHKAILPLMSLIPAIAMAEVLKPYIPNIGIKWPNDLYIERKKVGGILSRSHTESDRFILLIGIGINLDASPDDFPTELQAIATSLTQHSTHSFEPFELLTAFLNHYEATFDASLNRAADVLSRFTRLDLLNNQLIRIERENKPPLQGRAQGISANGGLRIFLDDEQMIKVVHSGTLYWC